MTHREFNNLSARRNLSSFIPARNQNIRPPRPSARINFPTYVPISREMNEPVNTENSGFISASWRELDLESFLFSNQNSILQSISLRERASLVNSTSEQRKETVLLLELIEI